MTPGGRPLQIRMPSATDHTFSGFNLGVDEVERPACEVFAVKKFDWLGGIEGGKKHHEIYERFLKHGFS